jgi:hypothetical protein
MPSSGLACDGRRRLAPVVFTSRLYWRPASGLRLSPPLQPRRLQSLRLAPHFMHPTRRRYNSRACAFLLYPPVFLPGTTYSFRSKLLRSVIASASTSGLRLRLCSLAVLPTSLRSPSARTGDQLQLSSRAAHLARPQCNLWLAPQVPCLWQRRRFNPWLTPVVHPSAKLATSSRLSVAASSPAYAGCLLPSTSVP